MAVDVPDSFIARNKTPPRYPPPRPQTQQQQVIYAPNGAMPQVARNHLSSSTSTASSTNGGGGGSSGVSLELQPLDSYGHPITNIHHNHHHNNHSVTSKGSPSIDSCIDFSKKSSIGKGPSSLGSTCESIGFDSMSYRTKSRGSLSTRSSSSGDVGPPEYDLGPHRELPVDVPENFVEMAKAPPRYPPPKPTAATKEMVKSKESLSSNGSIEKQLPQPQAPTRNHEVFFFCSVLFCFHFHLILIFWNEIQFHLL